MSGPATITVAPGSRAPLSFRAARVAAFFAAFAASPVGCGGTHRDRRSPQVVRPSKSGLAVTFAYGTTDGRVFSSSTTRGRPTIVTFVTTFDLASQVQVRAVDEVVLRQRSRPHAAAVVLEAPRYAVLADAFRESMGLSYPVAMAGGSGGSYEGPFGIIDRVPTTVVLNAAGVEVWRKRGLASPRELEEALAAAARRRFASAPGESEELR